MVKLLLGCLELLLACRDLIDRTGLLGQWIGYIQDRACKGGGFPGDERPKR